MNSTSVGMWRKRCSNFRRWRVLRNLPVALQQLHEPRDERFMSERQPQLPQTQTQEPSHSPQQQPTGGTKQFGCDDPKKPESPESIDTLKDQKLDSCDDPTPPSPKPEPCQEPKLDRLTLQPLGDDLHSLTEPAGQLPLPITTIELPPRLDYPFAPRITGLRGTLIEERAIPRIVRCRLRTAKPACGGSTTAASPGTTRRLLPTRIPTNGDFAANVRVAPADVPRLDATARSPCACTRGAPARTSAAPPISRYCKAASRTR